MVGEALQDLGDLLSLGWQAPRRRRQGDGETDTHALREAVGRRTGCQLVELHGALGCRRALLCCLRKAGYVVVSVLTRVFHLPRPALMLITEHQGGVPHGAAALLRHRPAAAAAGARAPGRTRRRPPAHGARPGLPARAQGRLPGLLQAQGGGGEESGRRAGGTQARAGGLRRR